jgi:hypothetical protein
MFSRKETARILQLYATVNLPGKEEKLPFMLKIVQKIDNTMRVKTPKIVHQISLHIQDLWQIICID